MEQAEMDALGDKLPRFAARSLLRNMQERLSTLDSVGSKL
jgi:hypothetical protein